jgi:trimethylamine--corrinoid protein Co-methyltransferase
MQLVNPGAPVFQSLLVSGMDPQSAEYLVTLPEKYLCNVAAIQMAHDWGVPSLAGTFGLNHSEPATWQLGRDSVYTALMCALAGTDITIGLGMLKASTLLVPEQIIFDDEIYHNHRILAQGLDTNPEGIALQVIEAVGPGGHFLSQKHTRAHMREIWIPDLTHPRAGKDGPADEDIQKRARSKFDRILAEHEPQPLEQSAVTEINLILEKAEDQLGR